MARSASSPRPAPAGSCRAWLEYSQALEWTYTADILDARSQARGLVKAVYTQTSCCPRPYKLAHRIIDNRSPVSIALTRQMLYRNAAQPDPIEAHRVDSLAMFYTSIADGKEGVRSFLEKRPPAFEGRASQMPPFYPWWNDCER